MSDWKTNEDKGGGNYLYIEELNANDGTSRRLAGIKTTQSVQDLKKAIAAELNNPEGWSTISVAFTDKELDNLNASLSSYAVEQGDTIYFTRSVTPAVNPPPYSEEIILKNIFFKHLDGRTLTVNDIPISWTIKQLRERLSAKHAMNLDEYRFLWGGKQLVDEKALESYGLGNESTIHMVMRLEGGTGKWGSWSKIQNEGAMTTLGNAPAVYGHTSGQVCA